MTTRHDNGTTVVGLLVCYDTPTAGRHAKEVLDRVIAQCGHEVTFDVRLWRTDLLDLPEGRWQAAMDAESSHLFAAAFTGNGEPQKGFKCLVEQWAQVHACSDAALVALQAGTTINPALIRSLRHIAEQHHVGFLYSGDGSLSDVELETLAGPFHRQRVVRTSPPETDPLCRRVPFESTL